MKTLYIYFILLFFYPYYSVAQSYIDTLGRKFTVEKPTKLNEQTDTTFTELTSVSLTGVSHGSAVWGDYDNDGDLDILLCGLAVEPNEISKIYRNEGNDTFIEMTSISLIGVRACEAAWGDYDSDGDLDILFVGITGGADGTRIAKVYRNEGGPLLNKHQFY